MFRGLAAVGRPRPARDELPRARRDVRQPRGAPPAPAARGDPAGPDELAWIARLAERFGVELSPYPSQVFDEVSELCYGGARLRRGRRARRAAASDAAAVAGRRAPAEHRRPGAPARRYRPLFSGPAVERVPELQFQRPPPRSSCPRRTRTSAGSSTGDAVHGAARTARRSSSARAINARARAPASCASPSEHAGEPRRPRRGDAHVNEPWWISAHQGDRDHQPRHARVRVHDLGRAQAARPHAAPLRPEPRRARSGSSSRSPTSMKLIRKEAFYPASRDRRALHRGARRLRLHRARRLRGDPIGRAAGRSAARHVERRRRRRARSR